MTARREFIKGAFAAGFVAASVSSAATAMERNADGATHLGLGRVIFDERFAAARAFADEARLRFVRASAINGSVHDLWYHDLFYRWRDAKYPIAGMTDNRALFLLEMMASDAGMRVVHRIHHHEFNGIHGPRVFGPVERRDELIIRLSKADADWPRLAADIAMSWPKLPTPVDVSRSDILSARSQALKAQTLVSWLIR